MIYFSLDTETGGLDSDLDWLEMALVLEDTAKPDTPVESLPYIRVVNVLDTYIMTPFAAHLNSALLKEIADYQKDANGRSDTVYTGVDDVVSEAIEEWLCECKAPDVLNIAAKNPAFDLGFVGELIPRRYRHRTIDPSILYVEHTDPCLPDMMQCKIRGGVSGYVAHEALEDARDVIRLLRKKGFCR